MFPDKADRGLVGIRFDIRKNVVQIALSIFHLGSSISQCPSSYGYGIGFLAVVPLYRLREPPAFHGTNGDQGFDA